MDIGEEKSRKNNLNLYGQGYVYGFDTAIKQVQWVIKRDFKDLKNVSVEDLCKHIENCFKEGE